MNVNGYETQTTFWQDFTIADAFGKDAIQDTYDRAFNEWKTNTVYLTELVMILNWKIWQHYDRKDNEKASLYDSLWRKTNDYALDNLKGEDMDYFFHTTD